MLTILAVIIFLAIAMIVLTFVSFGIWMVIPAICIFGIYKILKVALKKKEKPDLVIMSRADFEKNYTKVVDTKPAGSAS